MAVTGRDWRNSTLDNFWRADPEEALCNFFLFLKRMESDVFLSAILYEFIQRISTNIY